METGVIYFGLVVLVAALCGLIGQFITGYSRGGCPVAFIVGFAGTLLGPWAANQIGWPEPFMLPVLGVQFPLVSSAAGAMALVLLVNLATRKRKF